MNRLVVWGAGELGGRVGQLWTAAGGKVLGFTKTKNRHAQLSKLGIEPKQGNPVDMLQKDDSLLLAIPGHTNQHEVIKLLVEQNIAPPARAVLISLTGYYGNAHGVITESTPPGTDSRADSIAKTEDEFFAWAGDSGVVLRLGGLYSQDRGPFTALVRRGKVTRLAPPNKTMALMHYDDAATATFAALTHPAPKSVYLGVTAPCPTRLEFYTMACAKLGLPQPHFATPLEQPPSEFDVTQLRLDLLPTPAYPDWRTSIEGCNITLE